MAPKAGFEPTTYKLTVCRSTVELFGNGAPGRDQTDDLKFTKLVLYQLSYKGIKIVQDLFLSHWPCPAFALQSGAT